MHPEEAFQVFYSSQPTHVKILCKFTPLAGSKFSSHRLKLTRSHSTCANNSGNYIYDRFWKEAVVGVTVDAFLVAVSAKLTEYTHFL